MLQKTTLFNNIMNNLFKKALVFTDIHLGLRHNSAEHNEDCMEFIKWFIATGKEKGAETCLFLGDFMHHRNTTNVQTGDYGLNVMQLLNDNFEKVFFLVGNHDMYFREQRTITSSKFASLYPNIQLINEPTTLHKVALIPWLVDDEWKLMPNINAKYVFGHFELPGFKMNAHVEMPDHGTLNASHFTKPDYVFSGHFHKRQTKGKVTYIGNPFGHNYSDIWDFDRGAMFLEWDSEPEYINYEEGPRFININLSSLLENPELYLKPKTYLQVILDLDISYEEAVFLRETFVTQYNVREFKLLRNENETYCKDYKEADIITKPIDTIVIEQLTNIESDTFDPATLIEIYTNL